MLEEAGAAQMRVGLQGSVVTNSQNRPNTENRVYLVFEKVWIPNIE